MSFKFILYNNNRPTAVLDDYYKGATHDTAISNNSGIMNVELEDNERILADLAYIGIEYQHIFITPKKGELCDLSNIEIVIDDILKSQRQIIENLFSRLKCLSITQMKFRGDIDLYGGIIKSIFILLNAIILKDHPLRKLQQ